jgi:hypothetical protein
VGGNRERLSREAQERPATTARTGRRWLDA